MNKWVKRGGVALGVIVIGAGAAFAAMVGLGQRKLERHVDVSVMPVAFAADAASVERGRYLFLSRGCADCHGKDGGGRVVVEDGGCTSARPTSRARRRARPRPTRLPTGCAAFATASAPTAGR